MYSPSQDGAYYKICVLFGSDSGDKNASKLDKLVKSPVTFWTTAAKKFSEHELRSEVHKTAALKADNFWKVIHSQMEPVDQQLQSALATRIAENKLKFHSIIKIIFCSRQNISLRGHREGDLSKNPGNFKALLKFRIESGDQVLKHHFDTASMVAKYTSKNIQNEIIFVVEKWIQRKILEEVQGGSNLFYNSR